MRARKTKQPSREKGFLTLAASDVRIGDDGDGKARRFHGVAYTGDSVMIPSGITRGLPVVVDLSRLKPPTKGRPVLFDHDPTVPVGHFDPADLVNSGRELTLSGALSGANDATRQIVESAAQGFPWQMSVGVEPVLPMREIASGETVRVNGRDFTGPLWVTREAELKEISFVSLGADDNTSASVAAKFNKGGEMKFEEYAAANGFDVAELSDEQRKVLGIAWQATQKTEGESAAEAGKDGKDKSMEAGSEAVKLRLARSEAMMRIGEISADPKYIALSKAEKSEVFARARKENLSAEHAECLLDLALLRKSYTPPPGPMPRQENMDKLALTAGLMLRFGVTPESVEKAVRKPEAVDAGMKRFRNLSLKGLIAACCAHDGVSVPMTYDGNDTWLRAAFSSASFPAILADALNKSAVDAHSIQPQVSRKMARKLSVNDFKVNTGVMLTRGKPWDPVAADGKIKDGDIGKEEKFTYSTKTFGEIITITREMLKNDDLNMFDDFLSRIVSMGVLTEELNFFSLFHRNDGDFMGAKNKNLIHDSLSVDGLSRAVTAFRKQRDSSGNPINIPPRYLLVPPELEATALQLMASSEVRPAADSKGGVSAVANIHRGKYEVIVSAYLSSPQFGGKEEDLGKCWYLLPDPALAAAWGRVYLDGNESPIVEEVDVDPSRLGRSFRGYIDLDHCQIDPRCVVKSDGTKA